MSDIIDFSEAKKNNTPESNRSNIVKIVMFMNGLTLIGGDYYDKSSVLYLRHPLAIVDDGRGSIGFGPFMPYSSAKIFDFPKLHVMCITNPSKELEKAYREAVRQLFGGIITPSADESAQILPFLSNNR